MQKGINSKTTCATLNVDSMTVVNGRREGNQLVLPCRKQSWKAVKAYSLPLGILGSKPSGQFGCWSLSGTHLLSLLRAYHRVPSVVSNLCSQNLRMMRSARSTYLMERMQHAPLGQSEPVEHSQLPAAASLGASISPAAMPTRKCRLKRMMSS